MQRNVFLSEKTNISSFFFQRRCKIDLKLYQNSVIYWGGAFLTHFLLNVWALHFVIIKSKKK